MSGLCPLVGTNRRFAAVRRYSRYWILNGPVMDIGFEHEEIIGSGARARQVAGRVTSPARFPRFGGNFNNLAGSDIKSGSKLPMIETRKKHASHPGTVAWSGR